MKNTEDIKRFFIMNYMDSFDIPYNEPFMLDMSRISYVCRNKCDLKFDFMDFQRILNTYYRSSLKGTMVTIYLLNRNSHKKLQEDFKNVQTY